MKSWYCAFIVAFQFLTRLPIPFQVLYDVRSVSRSLLFYPLVGFTIGAFLYFITWALPVAAAPLNAALLLLIWTGLSGGLHMDGLMDTADGLGSHRSREQMLAIMKDSRVGAIGVLAAVFLILVKWVALWTLLELLQDHANSSNILFFVFISIPAVSRWWMVVAIVHWPYAGGEKGMGSFFREIHSGFIVGSSFIIVFSVFFAPSMEWIWLIGLQIFAGWMLTGYFVSRLGGLTGDTYGALNEITEAVGLAAAVYIMIGIGG